MHFRQDRSVRIRLTVAAFSLVVAIGVLNAAPQGQLRQAIGVGGVGNKTKVPARPQWVKQAPLRYAPDVVVVTYRSGDSTRAASLQQKYGLLPDRNVPSRYFTRYYLSPEAKRRGATVESMVESLRREPGVRSAEPDYAISPDQALPNDARFGDLWGLHNTGQASGTPDADVDGPEAWASLPAGPDVIVGVLDDGVLTTHPDLAANIYVNVGEIAGNGIDDDANGYVDDVRGWDTADNDNDPNPASATDSHGTHVAGTIGAVANNSVGVAGIARRVKILPIRMYEGQSTWMTSLANGIDFARISGAKVVNVSYNIDGFTTFLVDAITRAQTADIVYVNSSGNNGVNMDGLRGTLKQQVSNAMFVAATDRNDRLAPFSNYGQTTDLAAPGVAILSTTADGLYDFYDGTSMATPHVTGAVATVRAKFPSLTYRQIIDRVNAAADRKANLVGYASTAGRLNLANALEVDSVPPSRPHGFVPRQRASGAVRLEFRGSGDDGLIDQATYYEVRTSTSPITAGNYSSARVASMVPGGFNAGETVAVVVGNLATDTTHYFAVRAFDNVGNGSEITFGQPVKTTLPQWLDNLEVSNDWTGQDGKTWGITANANSGTKAWEDSPGATYANGEDSALTYNTTRSVTGPAIFRFAAKYDLESNYDFVQIEYTTDGTTWLPLGTLTGTSTSWQNIGYFLPNSGTTSFKFRFRLTSDSSVVRDGITIDDVSLVTASVVINDNMETAGGWSGTAPWARSTARANSPVTAWNDSPAGTYANDVALPLGTLAAVPTSGFADPFLIFSAYVDLESGYDFLDVFWGEGGTFLGSLTGTAGWRQYTFAAPSVSLGKPYFLLSTDGSINADGVCIDDVIVAGEPWQQLSTLAYQLNLDGYVGDAKTVTVELRNPTTQALIDSVTVQPGKVDSSYSAFMSSALTGNYSMVVKGDGWLRRRHSVTLAGTLTAVPMSLVNGDVNGDNVVSATDAAVVNKAFGKSVGQTGYDARADLTGDGVVNAADQAIVIRNLRKRGDN